MYKYLYMWIVDLGEEEEESALNEIWTTNYFLAICFPALILYGYSSK